MKKTAHVLVVDDEANVRKVLVALLEQAGHAASEAATGDEVLAAIRSLDPDLVLTDLKMPGMDGLELLTSLRRSFPEIPVVMLTAHGTIENAVEAMRRGAHDFLTKPFERNKVLEVITKALEHAARSRHEFQGPIAEETRCGIVGRSAAMEALFRKIERVAPTPATVLVTGETGTGKELVADALHRLSRRSDGPIVKINCAALPETLVESELFGYERGAFTGADRSRPGKFELADGGTLFLDEIGDLPTFAQAKLLRVLEDGQVDRLGGASRRVDVRLVTATNRDLDAAARQGQFRDDLLHRVRVVELGVPALRDRADDIPLLVEFFLEKHARRLSRPRPRASSRALEMLAIRSWPGNVRELENAVERAILFGESDPLEPADFGDSGRSPDHGPSSRADAEALDLKSISRAAAAEAEARTIVAALGATDGNITRAAERLGLSRRGLQLKMKDLGLR